jgi:UAA transporter family
VLWAYPDELQLNVMRRKHQPASMFSRGVDDADAGAGVPSPPQSAVSMMTSTSDIEFYEDLVSEPVLVLGVDISHLSRYAQFWLCATGVFFFSLLYGYLQELISVQICSRQLGLFLATVQFIGYTALAAILRNYVYEAQQQKKLRSKASNTSLVASSSKISPVPLHIYLGLSLLRAIDLGMTNLAMQYINYPAKTLMKSSRVVFTMIFGVLIAKKVYKIMDYMIVLCMVTGLAIFMHADANSSAVFQPAGVVMLVSNLNVVSVHLGFGPTVDPGVFIYGYRQFR